MVSAVVAATITFLAAKDKTQMPRRRYLVHRRNLLRWP
jgi:hypothetical protein